MNKDLFICALILIDRLCEKSKILLNEYNIHRIVGISCIVSIKLMEDSIYRDTYYTEVAGIDIDEFVVLESEFLEGIGFDLFISTELFRKYNDFIQKKFRKN